MPNPTARLAAPRAIVEPLSCTSLPLRDTFRPRISAKFHRVRLKEGGEPRRKVLLVVVVAVLRPESQAQPADEQSREPAYSEIA